MAGLGGSAEKTATAKKQGKPHIQCVLIASNLPGEFRTRKGEFTPPPPGPTGRRLKNVKETPI